MEIKSLAKTDFDTIFNAFNQAFADYEMQLDKTQLETMLKRRGFDPHLSFAAFDKGEIVAFTLNGTGTFNGLPTAYDTGTGTLKDYRGQGLATKVFGYSLPYLKERNIEQYLLEVLQHNTKAVSVYRNIGFEVARGFNYFMQKNEEIANKSNAGEAPFLLKHIDTDAFGSLPDFWDFYPSWQNSFESVKRTAADFICLGAFTADRLAGYCIFEPVSGDITQLAVDKQHRRKGIASLLLNEMVKLNRNDAVKVINTDVECHSVTAFLEAKNITLKGKQFEMVKKI